MVAYQTANLCLYTFLVVEREEGVEGKYEKRMNAGRMKKVFEQERRNDRR